MYVTYPESSYELTTSESIRKYLTGGKGIVTLQSPTGIHHTYAFTAPRERDKFPDNTLFVYSQVSSNEWLYCGMLDSRFQFKLTRASTWSNDCEIVKGAKYISRWMRNEIKTTPMKLYHAGVCSVCGKKLTHPKSILLGVGPRCRKKYYEL